MSRKVPPLPKSKTRKTKYLQVAKRTLAKGGENQRGRNSTVILGLHLCNNLHSIPFNSLPQLTPLQAGLTKREFKERENQRLRIHSSSYLKSLLKKDKH